MPLAGAARKAGSMRPAGFDREMIVVATLVILTGIALGMRAPLSYGSRSPAIMLSVPGRR